MNGTAHRRSGPFGSTEPKSLRATSRRVLSKRQIDNQEAAGRCTDLSAASLLALLCPVMTGLAEGLEVALVPEQAFVAFVLLDVIRDEQRRVALDPAASRHLAREQLKTVINQWVN